MSQSLAAIHVHLTFSTKDRTPYLKDAEFRKRLHAYMGGISEKLDCPALAVGGVEDHVHLLAKVGRTISAAAWVKELKRSSSAWTNEQTSMRPAFAWQSGYSCFSVSASNLDRVARYIGNQESHHRKLGFQDELRTLLTKHRISWDEKFVWG